MEFEVTILGSSAALPTIERNTTAQYVRCKNKHILIDCGEGTQLQMRKFGVPIQHLDIILISHLHGDHFFGLVALLSTMRLLGRDANLTIVCPKGLPAIINSQLEIGHAKLDFDIQYVELTGKETMLVYEDKAIEIKTFPLKHKIPTNGYLIREKVSERKFIKEQLNHPDLKIEYIHRLKKGENITTPDGKVLLADDFTLPLEEGHSYAYCSDTAYSEKIIEHILGCTVLYHEATFTNAHTKNAKDTLHSTAEQAATIAQRAHVSQLYMGHLSARYSDVITHEEEAQNIFKNAKYVHDGFHFEVKKVLY